MLRDVAWGLLCLLVGILVGRSQPTADGPTGNQRPTSALAAARPGKTPPEPPVERSQPTPVESDPVVDLHDQPGVPSAEAIDAGTSESTPQGAVEMPAPEDPAAPAEPPAAEPEADEAAVVDLAAEGLPAKQTLVSLPATLPADDVPALHEQCSAELPSLGTALQWAESPEAAARLARQQEKLVFLIHVSGNFEIPEFT